MQNSLTQIPLKDALTIAERIIKHLQGITKANYKENREILTLALVRFSRENQINHAKSLYENFIISYAFEEYTKYNNLSFDEKSVYFFDEAKTINKIHKIWERKGINTKHRLVISLIEETLQDLIKEQKSEAEILEYFKTHCTIKALFA